MEESPSKETIDQADLLLDEYLRGEKLPAFGSVCLILGSLLGIGILLNIGAAVVGLDAIELLGLGLCVLVCPASIVIPFLITLIVLDTTHRAAKIVAIPPSPSVTTHSNRQILHTLLKGAKIQVGSVILLVAVLAALIALNHSLRPSFWDRLAGSYGTYDPNYVYTPTEQAANALFWWVILFGVVCFNLIAVTAGLWLGLWPSSMFARLVAVPLMTGVIALLIVSLGIGAEISPNYTEHLPDAALIPALFCVLPTLGISFLFYGGANYSIRHLRRF